MCERKIDPKHIGILSKVNVEEWKKIVEKCIITNGTQNLPDRLFVPLIYNV